MLKMEQSVCIDAPAAQVWKVLSELDSIHLWIDFIKHSHWPGQRRGVGAMRVCALKQGTVRETIETWDEGRSFQYRGEGAPMVKWETNLWTVEAMGTQTLVTSFAEVVLKGGIFGRLPSRW